MKNRRAFLLTMVACVMALGVIIAPVIADELLGVITKIDVENKKLTVIEKDTDKEIEVTTNADTEVVTGKGANKIDLEKLSKGLAKAQDAGKKGFTAKITHEKGVASKIEISKKKGAPKKDN